MNKKNDPAEKLEQYAEVAEELALHPAQLAVFEGGLIPPQDMPEGFEKQLATLLLSRLEKQK